MDVVRVISDIVTLGFAVSIGMMFLDFFSRN